MTNRTDNEKEEEITVDNLLSEIEEHITAIKDHSNKIVENTTTLVENVKRHVREHNLTAQEKLHLLRVKYNLFALRWEYKKLPNSIKK